MTKLLKRPAIAALLIAIAAQMLFTVNLTRPSTLVFDEIHYVPAARTLMALERPTNTEHPLLGKAIIGTSMALFGDTALGWRAASTVAGTASVLGVFAILMLLFGSVRTAAYGALFACVNGMLFVQARIAMLDVFMGAFVLLGIAALLWAMRARPERVASRWLLGSVLLGLATAVKWAAAPYVAFAALGFLGLKASRRAELWPSLGVVRGIAILAGASVGAYFVTFLPAFFYAVDPLTPGGLLPFQWDMYQRQTQVLPSHPYQSSWVTWPFLRRPIWYLYEPVDGAVRGILLVGNPAVMWGGLVAIGALLWSWRRGSAKAGAVALLWIASLAVFAVIPKSLGFYYYYHLSALFLCVALAAAFHLNATGPRARWIECYAIACVALFVWFYPIISAAALPNAQAFNHWMWFDSWR